MIETLAVVLLVALDQLVKYLVKTNIPLGAQMDFIPHVLGLTHIHNNGAAFSMLSWGPVVFCDPDHCIRGLCPVGALRKKNHPSHGADGLWC